MPSLPKQGRDYPGEEMEKHRRSRASRERRQAVTWQAHRKEIWGVERGAGESQKGEVPLRKPITSPLCSQGSGRAETSQKAQLEASQVSPFPPSDRGAQVPCMSPGHWQKGFHGQNPRLQVRSTAYGSYSLGQVPPHP